MVVVSMIVWMWVIVVVIFAQQEGTKKVDAQVLLLQSGLPD